MKSIEEVNSIYDKLYKEFKKKKCPYFKKPCLEEGCMKYHLVDWKNVSKGGVYCYWDEIDAYALGTTAYCHATILEQHLWSKPNYDTIKWEKK